MQSTTGILLCMWLSFVLAVQTQTLQVLWGQCGGIGYNGPTQCENGSTCYRQSDWYSQCVPSTTYPALPTTSPVPQPSTNPVPTTSPVPQQSPVQTPTQPNNMGFRSIYDWTWDGKDALLPPGLNSMIAFSGWSNVDNMISESAIVGANFIGELYISFGGGNHNGRITKNNLASLNTAINNGRLSRYAGVCYDVEEGDSGLSDALEESFIIAKQKGLKVFVTVSHSAPYGISDKITVMESLFASTNVDFLSPQLYTSGFEPQNDYAWDGVSWEAWAKSKAPIVVSINDYKLFSDAESFFLEKGMNLAGYVQWKQEIGTSSQTPSLPTTTPIAAPSAAPVAVPVPEPTSISNAQCMCEFAVGCSSDNDCCPGQTCRSYSGEWKQCRRDPNYDQMLTTTCKHVATSPYLNFNDFGCVSDSDCCNPHAKCGSDGLCRLPHVECSNVPIAIASRRILKKSEGRNLRGQYIHKD